MTNFSNINDRIIQLIDFKANKNQKKFAEMIDFAPQVISNIVSGRKSKPSFDVLNAISSTFVDINNEWLLTGKGEMLKEPVPPAVSFSQRQENDKYIVSLEKQIALLEKNISLLEKENAYLEQRLELAELKDKEAMALKIRKQRKEIGQKDEIINLQNEELDAMKSISLPPDKPLHPSKRV